VTEHGVKVQDISGHERRCRQRGKKQDEQERWTERNMSRNCLATVEMDVRHIWASSTTCRRQLGISSHRRELMGSSRERATTIASLTTGHTLKDVGSFPSATLQGTDAKGAASFCSQYEILQIAYPLRRFRQCKLHRDTVTCQCKNIDVRIRILRCVELIELMRVLDCY